MAHLSRWELMGGSEKQRSAVDGFGAHDQITRLRAIDDVRLKFFFSDVEVPCDLGLDVAVGHSEDETELSFRQIIGPAFESDVNQRAPLFWRWCERVEAITRDAAGTRQAAKMPFSCSSCRSNRCWSSSLRLTPARWSRSRRS